MRLFIAFELPEAWRAAAQDTRARLTAALEAAPATAGTNFLRWVDPSLMHLTLRFLGEVEDAALPSLRRALDAHVAPVDLELKLAAPGTFGPPQRTQVLWLGVRGDLEALHGLARRIEQAVTEAGLPPEHRPLRAHLTLARVRPGAGATQRRLVASAVAALEAPALHPYRPAWVALVRSHLGPRGPSYEILSTHR